MELRTLDSGTAKQHYGEHEGKPFFDELVSFITGGPLVAMVVEGEQAVTAMRTLMGVTDPVKALPGTIRGDFGAGDRAEPGPRLRLAGIRRARDRTVLPLGKTSPDPVGSRGLRMRELSARAASRRTHAS